MDGWMVVGQVGGWGLGSGGVWTFLALIDCSSFSISSRANVGPFSKLVPNV